jgi:Ca-activated chloride channel family protein
LILVVAVLGSSTLACGLFQSSGPPRNAVVVEMVANSSLTPWLRNASERFNEERFKTEAKRAIYVQLIPMEAGLAVNALVDGEINPALWIPDEAVWVDLLEAEGKQDFQGDCLSIAQSPLVIAMWQTLAESLGWPGRKLGWLDVGSLAADPSAWEYYSGGQFGPSLRLGHTHPGISNSGAETLLAIVQAAESKTDAVTKEDLQKPIVQASVSAFEGAVSWFSISTDLLGETMQTRGSEYLGAAIMYESTAVYYGEGEPRIVPIYPFEGTFMATHPACLNQSVDDQTAQAAEIFRQYLLGEEAQRLALEAGLRPVNPEVPLGAPLDEGHGVDITQPEITFSPPSVEAILAVQELWQSARKEVNLVMLLDVSGSMRGTKVDRVKEAAIQFVEQMGGEDYLTLIAFSGTPELLAYQQSLATSRTQLVGIIEDLAANGDTTLYDAIGEGAAIIAQTNSPDTSNAMVVLTDGMDTASQYYQFDQALFDTAIANNTTIFAIAYGDDADEKLLADLASRTNGNFYLGDEASIAGIYEEMSAAFGGSAGIGR